MKLVKRIKTAKGGFCLNYVHLLKSSKKVALKLAVFYSTFIRPYEKLTAKLSWVAAM